MGKCDFCNATFGWRDEDCLGTLTACGHKLCKKCLANKEENKKCPECSWQEGKKLVGVGLSAIFGGFALVAAAPLVLAGIGFTSGGIAAGSMAAGMMSSAAVANGGGVAAGSLVAVLQSAGAAGIGSVASTALGAAGAGIGGAVGNAVFKPFEK